MWESESYNVGISVEKKRTNFIFPNKATRPSTIILGQI